MLSGHSASYRSLESDRRLSIKIARNPAQWNRRVIVRDGRFSGKIG
jgi:hypothetical protein